ncbi:hypothetical protein SteCoe_39024 [Stentor coeruleus]|uniref:Uncharacterized protein n=1 Tax=Stentor coeruleus TaxID=5963 RepID=A0A1R2AKY3_9CILI|nr:hypothetical protein SteCoe_39024 [Stentor coeruleus]
MQKEKSVAFKCVLLGDTATGKTSFIASLLENKFLKDYQSTIGASFSTYTIYYESIKITLNFWDASGNPRFSALTPLYFRQTDACLFFFDVANIDSFKKIKFHIDSVISVNSTTKLYAVGNKIDLEESRQISFEEAKNYFDNVGVIFWEISCKEKIMIQETARLIALNLLCI